MGWKTPLIFRDLCQPIFVRVAPCCGIGPFLLGGAVRRSADIYKTDAKVKEIVAEDKHLHHWLDMARERIHCGATGAYLLGGPGGGKKLGWRSTQMVRCGEYPRPL